MLNNVEKYKDIKIRDISHLVRELYTLKFCFYEITTKTL